MTRYTDDLSGRLERDLTQISDQASPSSTAWEAIQHRIDEQDSQPNSEPTMEVIMLDPDTNKLHKRPRTGWLVAASVAAIALIGGLVVVANRDDDAPPADDPEVPASVIPAPDPDAIDEDTEPAPEPDSGIEAAEPDLTTVQDLPPAGRDVAAGRYATQFLGVETTFDLPVAMNLDAARNGLVMFFGHLEPGEFTPDNGLVLAMSRISGWSNADEATQVGNGAASIDPYDVDTWIEENGIVVSSDTTAEVAGRTGRLVEVRLDADAADGFPCFPGFGTCIYPYAIASDVAPPRFITLGSERSGRYYLLTIEGSEPLLIEVFGPADSDWYDVVEDTFLATLELGPDAPPNNWTPPATAVTATGSGAFSDAGFEQTDLTPQGAFPFTATTNFEGDIAGAAALTGSSFTTVVTDGFGAIGAADFAFEGSIEGLGTGTMALTDRYASTADGTWTSTATVFGGTDDFENATGSIQFESSNGGSVGSYTYEISVLPEAPQAPVSVSGTYGDSGLEAVVNDDGSVSYSVTTNMDGQMAGPAPSEGRQWPTLVEGLIGTTDFVFEGTIDGLGDGTLTYYDLWSQAPESPWASTVVITAGTGDFEGAVGTGTFVQGEVEGAPGSIGSYTFEITVP